MNSILSVIYEINQNSNSLPIVVRKKLNDFKLLCNLSDIFTKSNPRYKEDLIKNYNSIIKLLLNTKYIDDASYEYLKENRNEVIVLLCLNSPSKQIITPPALNRLYTIQSKRLFVENFKELITINAHFSHIFTVKFDKQGKYLYSGSDDTVIKQWDVSTMLLIRTYTKHEREIGDLDISDCGQLMVSCSLDKQVMLWDTHSGTLLHTYKPHNYEITQVFFIENAHDKEKDTHKKYILSISDKEAYIHLFEYTIINNKYGIIKSSSIKQLKQTTSPFTAIEITDNKEYCVIAFKNHTLRVYSLQKGVMDIVSTVSIKEQIEKISIIEHKKEYIVILVSDKGTLFLHSLYKLIVNDPHELHSENLTKIYLDNRLDAKKRTIQAHRIVYMDGYIFISGNMDTIIGIKIGHQMRFFVAPKVHKEDNIFWMSTLSEHNILISGGADGYLVVWQINQDSLTVLDPILVYESQKYEEDDKTAEDILDITTTHNMVAIGTRFGGVTLLGLTNLINNDYSRTPTEQEFLEDIRSVEVPTHLFKTLVSRSGNLVYFDKEENKEAGFFRFEVERKNNIVYKVLKENIYHPELANTNIINQRPVRAVPRLTNVNIQVTPIEQQQEANIINSNNLPMVEIPNETSISEGVIEEIESENSNGVFESTENEPLSEEEETIPTSIEIPKPLSNPNLLNTSNEEDFLESESTIEEQETENSISNSQNRKKVKIVQLMNPVDFIMNQTLLRENSQCEEVYIPQMDDILIYSPEAHVYFLYLNKEILSDYTNPSYPFISPKNVIDGDRKCKVTNLTYRFHSEGLSNNKYGIKLIRVTLDVLEEQSHRFIKNNKLHLKYSRDRGIQFEVDLFLPHPDFTCNNYIIPFDIYEEHIRNKIAKQSKLRFKKECFNMLQTQIHFIHSIKDNRRVALNLLSDTIIFKLNDIIGTKMENIDIKIKSSSYFNNYIFTHKLEQQNKIVSELNTLKDNNFVKLLKIYKNNIKRMEILSLWDFYFEQEPLNFVYRSGINEMQKNLLIPIMNSFIGNDNYYLYREVTKKHYQDNYFKTVPNPIGLVDIKERIENDYYRSITQLLLELNIIYDNCLKCALSYSKFSKDCKKLIQEIKQKVSYALECVTEKPENN